MTPKELAVLGKMLYGERWQTPLSRDLNVSDRQVRRWVAGAAIPSGVVGDIIMLAACKQVEQICGIIGDVGSLPAEIPIQVYDKDEFVRDGGLTAATHRRMAEATAALLRENGLNAYTVETVKSI